MNVINTFELVSLTNIQSSIESDIRIKQEAEDAKRSRLLMQHVNPSDATAVGSTSEATAVASVLLPLASYSPRTRFPEFDEKRVSGIDHPFTP